MNAIQKLLALSALLASAAAGAHVTVSPATGAPGAAWKGALRVGHGCDGGAATTALALRLPAGVSAAAGELRSGWTAASAGGALTWKASPGAALADGEKAEFPFTLQLPAQPGPLWLKVRQECGSAAVDWADVPAQGVSTAGMKTPALLLAVAAAGEAAQAAVPAQVEGGWVRATVAGQQATGAFMTITVREPMQLVGVRSAVAGDAEVHEMRMDNGVMRMRPAGPIALQPGQPLELKPGGYHLMLTELKRPVAAGSEVPLTLLFKDGKGVERTLAVQLRATGQPPAGGAAHRH